ncbi:MAG: Uma2 family endonuclease [Burkholderiaceae bacterium]
MNAVVEQQRPLWLEQVSTRWREVLDDQNLRDLPYKIKTNRAGQLIMSPAKNIHAFYQGRISKMLGQELGGHTFAECSVATPEGVKVPDVAWCSDDFLSRYGFEDPCSITPEICVEIKSPSNAESELQAKVRLYLDAGAIEVWLADAKGGVRAYARGGALAASGLGIDISTVALDPPYA